MNVIDYIIIGIVVLVLGLVVFAIFRSRKKGEGCIGCPNSATCHAKKDNSCSCNNNN